MVLSQDTKQLLRGLAIKFGLGLLGFVAAFAAAHVGDFNINPLLVAGTVALLDNVADWANSRYKVAQKVRDIPQTVARFSKKLVR